MGGIVSVLSRLSGRQRYPMDEIPSPINERPILTTQKPVITGDLADYEELPTRERLGFNLQTSEQASMPARDRLGLNPQPVEPPQQTISMDALSAPPPPAAGRDYIPMPLGMPEFQSQAYQNRNALTSTTPPANVHEDVAQYVQQLMNPGPAKPEMPDHSDDEPRGFWGNVGHYLEHAGKGALYGLVGGGGIPGAIIGAAAGAIRPELADRAEYNLVTKPKWERDKLTAQKEADGQLERIDKYGRLTGKNPLTDEPTLQAQQYSAMNDYRRDGLDLRGKDVDSRIKSRDEANTQRIAKQTFQERQAEIKLLAKMHDNGELDEDGQAYFAQLAGLKGELRDKFLRGQSKIDAEGNYIEIDPRTHEAVSIINPRTGQAVQSFDKSKQQQQQQQFGRRQGEMERHNQAQESNARNRSTGAQRATITRQQSWNVLNKVQGAIDQAKKLSGSGSKSAGAAIDRARAMASQAQELYGDVFEVGGLGNGEIPYIKARQGGQDSGRVQTAPQVKTTITRQQYKDYVKAHGEENARKFMEQYKVTVQ